MVRASEMKKECMHLRLDADAKGKIARAARYSQKSLPEFVLSNAGDAAERVIEEHERMVLGDRDRDLFFDAILNPPEPNQALSEAMKWYRELSRD